MEDAKNRALISFAKGWRQLAKWRRAFLDGLQRWQNLTSAMIALAAATWAWQYAQRQIDIAHEQLVVVRRQADNANQQLIIAAKQAETFQRQLALLERDQRPLLYLEWKDRPAHNSAGRYIYWNFEVQNLGKSTATRVHWESNLRVAEDSFTNASHDDYIIPAGVKRWSTAHSQREYSSSEFARLINADAAIQLYVKVRYADANGAPYEAAECFVNFASGSVARYPVMTCEARVAK